MNVKLAILADYANVSTEGKLNILGIFERINVTSLPALHPQMHLVLRLEAHPTERNRVHAMQIRLQDPDGETVFELNGEVVPRGPADQPTLNNQILSLTNLALQKIGDYNFVIFVDNDLKAETPLSVGFGAEPPDEDGATGPVM